MPIEQVHPHNLQQPDAPAYSRYHKEELWFIVVQWTSLDWYISHGHNQ